MLTTENEMDCCFNSATQTRENSDSSSRESWDAMNCYQHGQTERKSSISKLMQVTNAKLF